MWCRPRRLRVVAEWPASPRADRACHRARGRQDRPGSIEPAAPSVCRPILTAAVRDGLSVERPGRGNAPPGPNQGMGPWGARGSRAACATVPVPVPARCRDVWEWERERGGLFSGRRGDRRRRFSRCGHWRRGQRDARAGWQRGRGRARATPGTAEDAGQVRW